MKKIFALTAVGLSLMPFSTFAAGRAPTAAEGATTRTATDNSAMCTAFVGSVSTKLASMTERSTTNAERMASAITKLDVLVEKATSAGVDASTLSASIATLEAYAADLAVDQAAAYAHTSALANVDCSTITAAEWQAKMAEGKALHEAMKLDIQAIKDLNTKIKEQIRLLVDGIKAATPTAPVTE